MVGKARACGIGAVGTFADGPEADGAAVRAILTEFWSNGQAAGQVSRLKPLEWRRHGHAGFNPLRQRVLMTA